MIQFLKSLSPKTRILLALILGGIVIFLFWATLFGFLNARRSMERVNQYNIAIGLARETNADFQLAVSKGKNFAILKDETNKVRSLDYFKKAKENFDQLSNLEQDPAGKELLFRMGAALKSVEFSLGILTSTARKNDPAENLYAKYLKDITIDFDEASQAYVDFLEGKILSAQWKTASETQMDLLFALAGALLGLVGMGLSYSIAYSLNQALRNETASQERYRTLSEMAEEAIMIHDRGFIVEANATFARLLGYSLAEVMGKHVSLFMDKPSGEITEKRIQKGYPVNSYELMARRKDGTTFPMLIHGRDIEYHGRKVRLSCGWDMTEWKKAEKALKESQERFERFAEVTKEGIMIHENGIIVDVNQALLEITGLSPLELIGTDGMAALPEDSARTVRKFAKSGFPLEPYEITLRHKNGSLIPVEVHGQPFVFEGRNLRVARFWDVTERRKMEQALKESGERYKGFAEITKEGIFIHDDGVVVDANESLAKMTGYSLSEIIGNKDFLFHKPTAKELIAKYKVEGYPHDPYEVIIRRKDGSFFPAEVEGRDFQWNGKKLRVVTLWDLAERKKAEAALKDSEVKFRSLIENSHDIIAVTGEDRVVTYMSPSVKSILGYVPSERIGQTFAPIMHPDDLSRMRAIFAEFVQKQGALVTAEFRLLHKDGSWRQMESVGINLLKNPSVKGIIYNIRDITEKSRAEEALRGSEENFRNLIEKSPDAVLVNQDNHIIYSNSKLLTLLGYDEKEELLGKAASLIVHPDDQKIVGERIKTLSQGGRTSPVEIRLLRRDGAELPVETASINIQFQGGRAIMVNLRDITARKQAEAMARENQERYRSLVESMPDAVMVHDEERVLFVNPASVRIFGAQDQAELLDRPFWTVVPPEFQKAVRERIRGTMERGQFNEPAERKLLKLDGTPLDVLVTSVPFNDRGRRVVLAIFSDISARKEAERKAQRYQRLAALGEMAAGLAHEIRNPAAAISAQAQYLLKKTEEGAPSYEQLKDIIAQCDRLDTLVHDTLDYSPEKKFEERTEIPAKDLLQKTLWLAQTQFGPSHARVQVILDVQPDLPLLKVHPTRMERVLVNLILNAFQAMPEGGHLLLRANRLGNKAILRVEDDGKGFTEEQRTRLFEPFFTSRKMGSGLGLAICQKIVEEHQGQIRVERVEPHGAAFAIEIPLNNL